MTNQATGILVKADQEPSATPSQRHGTHILGTWSQTHQPILYLSVNDLYIERGTVVGTGWFPNMTTDQWEQRTMPIGNLYNRFPIQQALPAIQQLSQWTERHAIPFANHPLFQALVTDKYQTDRLLQAANIPTPATYPLTGSTLSTFVHRLQEGESYFIKPTHGAFGEGITRVREIQPGILEVAGGDADKRYHCETSQWKETWSRRLQNGVEDTSHSQQAWLVEEGIIPKDSSPGWIYQRAIAPPFSGMAGCSIRSLVQCTQEGSWRSLARVARVSSDDPVANVARGAKATPLFDLLSTQWSASRAKNISASLQELEQGVADCLQRALPSRYHRVVEMGMDILLDPEGQPWLLEINGFPQGRLGELARIAPARFETVRQQAHTHPIEVLLQWQQEARQTI